MFISTTKVRVQHDSPRFRGDVSEGFWFQFVRWKLSNSHVRREWSNLIKFFPLYFLSITIKFECNSCWTEKKGGVRSKKWTRSHAEDDILWNRRLQVQFNYCNGQVWETDETRKKIQFSRRSDLCFLSNALQIGNVFHSFLFLRFIFSLQRNYLISRSSGAEISSRILKIRDCIQRYPFLLSCDSPRSC